MRSTARIVTRLWIEPLTGGTFRVTHDDLADVPGARLLRFCGPSPVPVPHAPLTAEELVQWRRSLLRAGFAMIFRPEPVSSAPVEELPTFAGYVEAELMVEESRLVVAVANIGATNVNDVSVRFKWINETHPPAAGVVPGVVLEDIGNERPLHHQAGVDGTLAPGASQRFAVGDDLVDTLNACVASLDSSRFGIVIRSGRDWIAQIGGAEIADVIERSF